MTDSARIYVIDSDAVVREALRQWLGAHGHAVQLYGSAEEFLSSPVPPGPGCVVVDLHLPGMDGLALQAHLARQAPWLAVVFLSGHADVDSSVRALKAGAVDFMTKPAPRERLLDSVAQGITRSRAALEQASNAGLASDCLHRLTGREREVLMLAVHGLHDKEIARRLNISHRTVEIHKARIRQKTGAGTLVDLVRLASESGLEHE